MKVKVELPGLRFVIFSRQAGEGLQGLLQQVQFSVCKSRAGVGHCEGVQSTKAAQLLLVVFKGEQYLTHLPFLGLNMAFDNNVTKNLWYNSKP